MVRVLQRAVSGFAVAAVVLLIGNPAQATHTPPNSMASLGNSITRAFNACGWYVDCTSRSWSTGGSSYVYSHYRRILEVNPYIRYNNYNDARSGAKAADLPGQANTAVDQRVEYVTILMGANDACTSSESTMTSVATFRSHVKTAMSTLVNGLSYERIFVASIPDIKRLWYVGKDDAAARYAWDQFDICQSMLANPRSTDQADVDRRNRVRQRVIDFNTALREECQAYANCRFDGNAVFNYPFAFSHLSEWDYFHPNTSGQNVLADVSYKAGYNW